jgi:hypothetical protein
MRRYRPSLIAAFILICPALVAADPGNAQEKNAIHFPGPVWPHKAPAEAGLNPQLLKDAIDFAVANEVKNPRNLKLNHYQTFGREPFRDAVGPIKDRGDPTGVVVRNGYIWPNGASSCASIWLTASPRAFCRARSGSPTIAA